MTSSVDPVWIDLPSTPFDCFRFKVIFSTSEFEQRIVVERFQSRGFSSRPVGPKLWDIDDGIRLGCILEVLIGV